MGMREDPQNLAINQARVGLEGGHKVNLLGHMALSLCALNAPCWLLPGRCVQKLCAQSVNLTQHVIHMCAGQV